MHMARDSSYWVRSSVPTIIRSGVSDNFLRRQKRVEMRLLSGVVPEFDLTSAQWSGTYHSARYDWDSFVTLPLFPGPRVSAEL